MGEDEDEDDVVVEVEVVVEEGLPLFKENRGTLVDIFP